MANNEDYQAALDNLNKLDVGDRQRLIADGVSDLPEDKKTETLTKATTALSTQQKQAVAVKTTQSLTQEEQKEVARQIALPPPTSAANDRIWLIVISAFSIILVGIVLVMAIGWFNNKPFEPNFLTIFTTVSAFLIGLFAQSPVK